MKRHANLDTDYVSKNLKSVSVCSSLLHQNYQMESKVLNLTKNDDADLLDILIRLDLNIFILSLFC